jgi:hypothetical protein
MYSIRVIVASTLGLGFAAIVSTQAHASCGGCGYGPVYAPAAIYVQPQTVYVQPQVIYQQPVYVAQPVYVTRPAPLYPPVSANPCAMGGNGFIQYMLDSAGSCAARNVAPVETYSPAYQEQAADEDAPVYRPRRVYYPRRPVARYSEQPVPARRHAGERILHANAVVRVRNDRMDIVLTGRRNHSR